MKQPIETILQIENSLATRLGTSLRKYLTPILKELAEHTSAQKWDDAYRIITAIDVAPTVEDNDTLIQATALASMKFGAGRISDSVSITPDSTEALRTRATKAFKSILSTSINNAAKAQLRDEISSLQRELLVNTVKADTLLRPFQSFSENADTILKVTSQLHTSRLSALGFTAEADIKDILEYKVNEQLDNRGCPVCREMHGKSFSVESARGSLMRIIDETDPEVIKQVQGWPSQSKDGLKELRGLTSEQLVSRNWHIPPYHPYCRGILVPASEQLPPLPTGADDKLELPVGNSQQWTQWANTLSADTIAGVETFSMQGSTLNRFLRSGGDDTLLTLEVEQMATAMADAMAKAPVLAKRKTQLKVYATTKSFGSSITDLKVGDTVTDLGYLSTSILATVAYESAVLVEAIPVIVRIPVGSTLIDMESSGLSLVPTAKEVVLNKGSTYKVVATTSTKEGILTSVTVELLP